MDYEELINIIDEKIDELEKENYSIDNSKFIEKIEFEIADLQNNIELIYSKYLYELDKLIGLNEVKEQIKKLINYLIFLKKVSDKTNFDNLNLNMVFRAAQNNYQQAQMMMNQATTNYDTNVSIWLEAQQAQLQAEQDSVIGALQYEQTIMEIDNTYCEQRLKRIDQEIQSYDKLIDDRTEKNVPKFGLG